MYFEAVFSFYVLLYHFVGHSLFGLVYFGSFCYVIKRNFSLTLTKLNFYVDMSVWLFVGKQYHRLNVNSGTKLIHAAGLLNLVSSINECRQVSCQAGGLAGNVNDLVDLIVQKDVYKRQVSDCISILSYEYPSGYS